MKKQLSGDQPLLDVQEAQMKLIRRKAECKFNDGVICGLWDKDPERCARCNWNPDKGKPAGA